MKLRCYAIGKDALSIVPAAATRHWMDQHPERGAYRCLPLSIANSYGWEILSPTNFAASWNGGPEPSDISFQPGDDYPNLALFVRSHFTRGIITFRTGYLFQTDPGWELVVSGPHNRPKHGIAPLTGIVETDWLPFPFTMNWHFTAPGVVSFSKDEPICVLYPVPKSALESVEPTIQSLADDEELKGNYELWRDRREDFLNRFDSGEESARKQAWQKFYAQGRLPSDSKPVSGHRARLLLRTPEDQREK